MNKKKNTKTHTDLSRSPWINDKHEIHQKGKNTPYRSDLLGAELKTRPFYEEAKIGLSQSQTYTKHRWLRVDHGLHWVSSLSCAIWPFHSSQTHAVYSHLENANSCKATRLFRIIDGIEFDWKKQRLNQINRNHADDDGCTSSKQFSLKVKEWKIIANHPTANWRKSIHCLAIKNCYSIVTPGKKSDRFTPKIARDENQRHLPGQCSSVLRTNSSRFGLHLSRFGLHLATTQRLEDIRHSNCQDMKYQHQFNSNCKCIQRGFITDFRDNIFSLNAHSNGWLFAFTEPPGLI